MDQQHERGYPFYIKATTILIGLVVFVFILHTLGDVLIPLAFSILIAILLNPLYNRLERVLPKVLAILVTILLGVLVIAVLFYFLSTQINTFAARVPALKVKLTGIMAQSSGWTKSHFGIDLQKQAATISKEIGAGGALKSTVTTIIGIVGVVVLMPVYIFLILFYKPLLLDFFFRVFAEKHSLRVAEILGQTKTSVQSFMQGLMLETAIVCTLNSVALLIIGVPSAIIIGVIGGILNILPYIGGLVAIALPLLMSMLVSNGLTLPLLVVGAYLLIQFIDNHFLVPYIVSSKVQINALISIVGVLLGGALWGVGGMFLAIPWIGVMKIIFDRIDGLKPWGALLGDEVPTVSSWAIWQKRWNRIFRYKEKKEQEEKENHLDNSSS